MSNEKEWQDFQAEELLDKLEKEPDREKKLKLISHYLWRVYMDSSPRSPLDL